MSYRITRNYIVCVCDMLGVLNYFPGNFINAKNQDAFDEGGTQPKDKKKSGKIYILMAA